MKIRGIGSVSTHKFRQVSRMSRRRVSVWTQGRLRSVRIAKTRRKFGF